MVRNLRERTKRHSTILLAFSNVSSKKLSPLRSLQAESDYIVSELRQLAHISPTNLVTMQNATTEKLIEAFRSHCVQLFHFGGHASGTGLICENSKGLPEEARATALGGFLGSQKDLVLVFLNGCYTEPQVKLMRQAGVRAVVATTSAIRDTVAAEFARQFYAELANRPLVEAFNAAVHAIRTIYKDDSCSVRRDVKPRRRSSNPPPWPWIIDCDPDVENWRLFRAP